MLMLSQIVNYVPRVLLASIRNNGGCPCPRCLIPKVWIQNLGMVRDRQQRLTLQRLDDQGRQYKIAKARHLIYKHNYAVDSSAVDKLLKPESLVPTSVRCTWYIYYMSTDRALECILRKTSLWRILLLCYIGRWFATWVWIGCMESIIYAFDTHSGISEPRVGEWAGLSVRGARCFAGVADIHGIQLQTGAYFQSRHYQKVLV